MKKRIISLSFIVFTAIALVSLAAFRGKPSHPTALKNTSANQGDYFLMLSDIHLSTLTSKTKFGKDTGMDMWAKLQKKLNAILNSAHPPKFILYTGDLPAHIDSCEHCYLVKGTHRRQEHDDNLKAILTGLRDLVAKNHMPLIYVPGNNDAVAGDYFSFADSDKSTCFSLIPETSNPYPALNTSYTGHTPPCMLSNPDPEKEYYTVEPVPGLRIIVLNSIILGRSYHAVDGTSQLDAGNAEMSWLTAQLAEARKAGDKAYIAMHIPPGIDAKAFSKKEKAMMWAHLPSAQHSWQDEFLALNKEYRSTIAGVLFGHIHTDEIRRIYDPSGKTITQVAVCCPGVTTNHKTNPGFKMVWYDAKSKAPTDFETSYTTVDDPEWGNSTYRFSEVYHSKKGQSIYDCISAQSIDDVYQEMNSIYTVKHGTPEYDTREGIEIKPGQ